MRRSNIVATGLAVAFVAVVGSAYFAVRKRPAPDPRETVPVQVVAPEPPSEEPRFELPPEPEPPAAGTAAHRPYYQAMVDGDRRGLELARSSLAEAAARPGKASPRYVQTLQTMERAYAERLVRHERALATVHPPASERSAPGGR
jgi:hypothetical protein